RAALVSGGGAIEVEHLRFDPAPQADAPTEAPGDGPRLEDVVQRAIARALAAEGGHVGRAAVRLGVPRSSLYKRLKKQGGRVPETPAGRAHPDGVGGPDRLGGRGGG